MLKAQVSRVEAKDERMFGQVQTFDSVSGDSLDTATKTVSQGGMTQDARTLVGAFGRYRVSKRIEVALNVDNVLDETYYANAIDSGYGNLFYGEPRRWVASVRGDF